MVEGGIVFPCTERTFRANDKARLLRCRFVGTAARVLAAPGNREVARWRGQRAVGPAKRRGIKFTARRKDNRAVTGSAEIVDRRFRGSVGSLVLAIRIFGKDLVFSVQLECCARNSTFAVDRRVDVQCRCVVVAAVPVGLLDNEIGALGRQTAGGRRRVTAPTARTNIGGIGIATGLDLVEIGAKTGLGEFALASGDSIGFFLVERNQNIEAILIKIAVTTGHRVFFVVSATAPGFGLEIRTLDALIVFAQDEVDYATDGIRAVHGRGTVFKNLDTLDGGEWNRIDINCCTLKRIVRQAPTV